MDAIVLAPMPQTPVQTPGQNGQTAGRNESSFGPVLSQAITSNSKDSKVSPESSPRHGSPADHDRNVSIEAIDSLDELNAFLAANNLTFEELPLDLREMIVSVYGHPNQAAPAGESASFPMTMLPAGMAFYPHDQLPPGMEKFLERQLADGETLPQLPAGLYAQKKDLTLILSQLQQIIDANEVQGAVVRQVPAEAITLDELTGLTQRLSAVDTSVANRQQTPHTEMPSSAASIVAQTTENSRTANPATVLAGLTGEAEAAPNTPTTSLRQEMQMSTDARMPLANSDREQAGQQPGKQDNNAAAQQAATSAVPNSAGSQPDQPLETGVFSTVLQESAATRQPQANSGTVTLPSGTMVSEQEVINQVVQRFQLTARIQSTKINIRLHPAELGELKIDLTVREGSIRASVFAQHQHAHEILERNMPKLRSILEQQGFTIDEIVVSFKPETTREFDLFDGRSAQDRQFAFSENSSGHSALFESVLDTSPASTTLPDAGLSIRA